MINNENIKAPEFLLSICIPTYNRCNALRATLKSIVTQSEFVLGKVQICISDNASSDSTASVVEDFKKFHPLQIKYIKQEINIWDKNFQFVLGMADGHYIKINNDTLCHSTDSLSYLISEINNSSPNEALFFNGGDAYDTHSLDAFSKRMSFNSTWVGGFGIWQEDKNLVLSLPTSSKNLWQTEVSYFLVSLKKHAKVRSSQHTYTLEVGAKGPYDFNDVFINQYLSILIEWAKKQEISSSTYTYLKRNILLSFCTSWAARSFLRINAKFKMSSHFNYLMYWYKNTPHLLAFYIALIFIKIIRYIPQKLHMVTRQKKHIP